MHEAANGEDDGRRSGGGEKLCAASSTELSRHQSGENDCGRACERGEETKTGQRRPEKVQRQPAEEWRDRRISDISPRQVARIIQRGELVAMEAVTAAYQAMHNHGCGCQCKEQRRPGTVAASAHQALAKARISRYSSALKRWTERRDWRTREISFNRRLALIWSNATGSAQRFDRGQIDRTPIAFFRGGIGISGADDFSYTDNRFVGDAVIKENFITQAHPAEIRFAR